MGYEYARPAVRAARSALRLDEVRGKGWAKNIYLPALVMNDCEECMVGQLSRLYDDVPDVGDGFKFQEAAAALVKEAQGVNVASYWGFDVDLQHMDECCIPNCEDCEHETYSELKRAWIKEIEKRVGVEA